MLLNTEALSRQLTSISGLLNFRASICTPCQDICVHYDKEKLTFPLCNLQAFEKD